MRRPRHAFVGAICALALFAGACANRKPVVTVQAPAPLPAAPPPATVPPPPITDPIADLIALSLSHYERGQRELQEGHLEMARTQFNQALEVLLASPYGARVEPRLREHFDRLVEKISAHEVTALAQGDGFTEQRLEPARIDELLGISTFEGATASTETVRTVAEDLQATAHDIDIPLNERVLAYVQLFTGRLKDFLEEGLNRGTRYLPMIQEVFKAEGIPLDLAYVPLVESAFKTNALSKAKARGMWQFMRGTALENGLEHDWYIDERSDPEKATRAAAKYLKTLHKMFGDWHLALASYNGGPGRVQRAMKRSGKDDFWTLSSTKRFLPRETRDYVPLILAAVIIAKNPTQYGMNLAPLDMPIYETVTLPAAVDLRRIAEWSGAPVQDIQDLNPELRRWTTPVRANDYSLKVPAGTADLIRAGLLSASADALAPLNHHVVKKGETLATIAKKLKVNRADLAEANYLSTRAKLTAGQQLIIPRAPATLLALNPENPAPALETLPTETRPTPDAALAVNVAPARPTPPPVEVAPTRVVHRVKRGETLFSIAKRYGTTVALVRQWNRLRGSAIQAGQRLTILRDRSVATN
jgi:membrane-bound lytic murein transglycosylase D